MSDPTPTPPAPTPAPPKAADPDWKDKEIRDLRDECAAKRVENNTLKEQVATLTGQVQTSNTKIEELTGNANTAAASLLKLTVAIKAGVPGEQAAQFAELLQGSTEEELTQYASRILTFNGGPTSPAAPYDPSQGRGVGDGTNTTLTAEQEFNVLLRQHGFNV